MRGWLWSARGCRGGKGIGGLVKRTITGKLASKIGEQAGLGQMAEAAEQKSLVKARAAELKAQAATTQAEQGCSFGRSKNLERKIGKRQKG